MAVPIQRGVAVSGFQVEVARAERGILVALIGELDLAAVPALRADLDPVLKRYRSDEVVVDCTHLEFIDVAGLGGIVSVLGNRTPAARPRLVNVAPFVIRLLRLTRLDDHFDASVPFPEGLAL